MNFFLICMFKGAMSSMHPCIVFNYNSSGYLEEIIYSLNEILLA